MKHISECCSSEALKGSLKKLVFYEFRKASLEQRWFGTCSSCFYQATFNLEEEQNA